MRIPILVLVALASTVATVVFLPTSSAESGPAAKGDPCTNPAYANRDGDGQAGSQCGGPDCDDDDRDRWLGNTERCDGTLIGGQIAAGHDEDCNASTVHNAALTGDGDADGDGFVGSQCTNPWITKRPPVGFDRHQIRVVTKQRLTQGVDCDDRNYAVVPGAQICAAAASTSVCGPSGGFAMLPTSSALEKVAGEKAVPPSPVVDPKTGFANVACPGGTTCRSQPDGTGDCR